jgi:hypothetical protein
MQWYVYHSQKSMGHAYSELGGPMVFSTKNQPKLCHGDAIWVVECDQSNPTYYSVVDCFLVKGTDIPPFPGKYSEFKVKAFGDRSLLSGPVSLSPSAQWFADLRDRFITKQRFFSSLQDHPQIQDGLRSVSGVAI